MLHVSEKQQVLSMIAALASTPVERLQGDWVAEDATSTPESLTRLQRLYTVVGVQDEETKARFLTHLHLDEEHLLRVLSSPVATEKTPLPGWITTLEHILSESDGPSFPTQIMPRDRCLLQDHPLPFEEFFLPFIRYARKQFLSLVPDYLHIVSEEAMSMLELQLIKLLSGEAGSVVAEAFSQFRTCSGRTPPFSAESRKERILYDAFLRQYQGAGLLAFFAERAVLARLLVLLVAQWIEVCAEFFQRLAADRERIIQHFHWSQSPGLVVALKARCSEPHHHGRTVFLMTFAEGQKLVYKPRSMEIDQAFFSCLAWFNAHGLSLDLKCAQILSRGTYGWMEYVEHLPCTSREEVQSYYQRAGQLLCLLYMLGSIDIHNENLIASGAYPYLIDLETILSAKKFRPSSNTEETDHLPYHHSLLASGMLPMKIEIVQHAFQASIYGLSSRTHFMSPRPCPIWKDINTDAVMLAYEYVNVSLDQQKNRVSLDGSIMPLSDFGEELLLGFRRMYRFLLDHRSALLAADGPLSAFHGCPVRIVFRPTEVYGKYLTRLTHPQFSHDASDRWIEAQAFKRLLLKTSADPYLWAIADAELNALQRLDFPWFGARADSKDLFLITGETVVENILAFSPLEQVRFCLSSLSDEDLELQVESLQKIVAEEIQGKDECDDKQTDRLSPAGHR